MPKEKKKKRFTDFRSKSITVAPAGIHAVFYDPNEQDWCHFPVILFAVGTTVVVEAGEVIDRIEGVVRGMTSNHGGLELVEDTTDLEFIGYWREDTQEQLEDFFSDHGIERAPSDVEDEDEGEESDDND